MSMTPVAVLERLRTPDGQKLMRYSVVSVISVAVSTIVLLFCSGIIGWTAVVSNTVATGVATIPSYELNRRWAWGKSGRGHLWKEAVPFWVLSFVGWGFSTLCVHYAESFAKSHHYSHLVRTGMVGITSIAAFGILWIVKFVIFNKVLFAHRPMPAQALDGRAGIPT